MEGVQPLPRRPPIRFKDHCRRWDIWRVERPAAYDSTSKRSQSCLSTPSYAYCWRENMERGTATTAGVQLTPTPT
eukprot:1063360-Pyramimonas_sp.AAC.1